MAVHSMENEHLIIQIEEFGAELISVKNKLTGSEYMWEGNPTFWNRRSPVLFPFVGSHKDKKYSYGGLEYPMGQHGFARDMEFELIGREDHKLVFSLESNSKTLECYPFQFCLEITYILNEKTLEIYWNVKNKDSKKMFFQIGAHPAFLCPMNEGEKQSDYYLAFEHVDELTLRGIDMETSLAKRETTSLKLVEVTRDFGYLPVLSTLFDNDALVIEERQTSCVQLCKPDKTPYVTVRFDAPLFGIWSPAKKNAPFVCIEPWYGRCDGAGFEGTIEEKEYINSLEGNEEFHTKYDITFN